MIKLCKDDRETINVSSYWWYKICFYTRIYEDIIECIKDIIQ